MKVYAQTGQVSVGGKFETKTWLAFYRVAIPDSYERKYLGKVDTDFPIKYPLTLDTGLVIQENDYYRKYE